MEAQKSQEGIGRPGRAGKGRVAIEVGAVKIVHRPVLRPGSCLALVAAQLAAQQVGGQDTKQPFRTTPYNVINIAI